MKKIILSFVIASATMGLTSCYTTVSNDSPGYSTSYVYSTGYGAPYFGYGRPYRLGWSHNNYWYGPRYYGAAYAPWHNTWHGGYRRWHDGLY